MVRARLHDASALDVDVAGDGPAVLMPVNARVMEGEAAEQMRAWGADPSLGHTLVESLAQAGFRVVAADYEGHLADHPQPSTLTPDSVAADLLAIADSAGAGRFAYYGYSWLAAVGLQLAIRTDRLTALAMGGFPPLGGPYGPMLTVTRSAHRQALANVGRPAQDPAEIAVGDWEAAEVTLSPQQTQQYVTLYESLEDFDERAALDRLSVARLAFAGTEDNITYGAKWDDAYVPIGEALAANRDELVARGWRVELVAGADHTRAMQAAVVLPILTPWLSAGVSTVDG